MIVPDTTWSRQFQAVFVIGSIFQLSPDLTPWQSDSKICEEIIWTYLNTGIISDSLFKLDRDKLYLFYCDLWNCPISRNLWLEFFDKHLEKDNPTVVLTGKETEKFQDVIPAWRYDLNHMNSHWDLEKWREVITTRLVYPLVKHLKILSNFQRKSLGNSLFVNGLVDLMIRLKTNSILTLLVDSHVVDRIRLWHSLLENGLDIDDLSRYGLQIQSQIRNEEIETFASALKGANSETIMWVFQKIDHLEAQAVLNQIPLSRDPLLAFNTVTECLGHFKSWDSNYYKSLLFATIRENQICLLKRLMTDSKSDWNEYLTDLASQNSNFDSWQSLPNSFNLKSIILVLDWLDSNDSSVIESVHQKFFDGCIFQSNYNSFRYLLARHSNQSSLEVKPIHFEHLILDSASRDLRILQRLLEQQEYLTVFDSINKRYLIDKLIKKPTRVQYLESVNMFEYIFNYLYCAETSDKIEIAKLINSVKYEPTVNYLFQLVPDNFIGLNKNDIPERFRNLLINGIGVYVI